MALAVMYGRTPELAHQELLAVVPAFPPVTLTASVPGQAGLLKVEGVDVLSFENLATPALEQFWQTVHELQNRLGGAVRLAWLTTSVDRTAIEAEWVRLVQQFCPLAQGKVTVGLSAWGKGFEPRQAARGLKTALQAAGYAIRTVVPPAHNLSAAQVIHNHLVPITSGRGIELVALHDRHRWHVGITLTIQDIADYAKRDFGVPAPDPVSGMLPPKLAQTMINLAVGGTPAARVYDPFCGNGRIVLEARLMGFSAYGSDIEAKKVAAAEQNLTWLYQHYAQAVQEDNVLCQADARDGLPPAFTRLTKQPWFIVTEPYLGRPLRRPLTIPEGEQWLHELVPLYEAFFQTWSKPKHRPQALLVVMPRARVTNGSEVALFSSFIDRLPRFGYHAEVLFCYDRPDSLVRRDLVRFTYS